jgi:hypothetical protein
VKTKRRTEVTIEIEEAVIRNSKGPIVAWCANCAENVRMLEAHEAAVAAGISSRAIYCDVEAGRLHFVETGGGSTLICLNSLSQAAAALVTPNDPPLSESKVDTTGPVSDAAPGE